MPDARDETTPARSGGSDPVIPPADLAGLAIVLGASSLAWAATPSSVRATEGVSAPLLLATIGGAILIGLRLSRIWRLAIESRERLEARRSQALEVAAGRLADALAAVRPSVIERDVEPQPGHRSPYESARQALEQGRWAEARRIAQEQLQAHPEDPEAIALAAEVESRREEIADRLRARLEASRSANDPDSVLESRELLVPLIPGDVAVGLDRRLLPWLMGLLMRRMRTGTVAADVASLAERIAETFGHTTEGASVRASLPTLRRSAGLCSRCARPYTGVEAACPDCLIEAGPTPAAGPLIFPLRPEEEDEAAPSGRADELDDPFLREPS